MTLRNFYLSNFKGRDCWIKSFLTNDVNILMPKLDSVVGEEACFKTAFS